MAEDKKQKWDGRISTRVPKHSFPELFEDLSQLTHRHRGDRLRSLAIVGLSVMRNLGSGVSPVMPAVIGTEEQDAVSDSAPENDEEKIKRRRESLKKKSGF